jgi:hypothetical protein
MEILVTGYLLLVACAGPWGRLWEWWRGIAVRVERRALGRLNAGKGMARVEALRG